MGDRAPSLLLLLQALKIFPLLYLPGKGTRTLVMTWIRVVVAHSNMSALSLAQRVNSLEVASSGSACSASRNQTT